MNSLITYIQVYPIKEPKGKVKAFVQMTICDALRLTGMRIVDGANGLFLSFPIDNSSKSDSYKSIFYPLSKELRDEMSVKALQCYNEQVDNSLPF
jgi:stage V sporulation protein G